MRVTDTNSFIHKANIVHSLRYDYSKSVYTKSDQKIEIICKEHGSFWQIARDHYNGGFGCSRCSGLLRKNHDEFVKSSREIHGNRYIYPKSKYVNSKTKLNIICRINGEFQQTPDMHLRGRNCPKCSDVKRGRVNSYKNKISLNEFIEKCSIAHLNIYDYSKTDISLSTNKITVTCRIHGDFRVTAREHLLYGRGCKHCSTIHSKYNRGAFIQNCKKNADNLGTIYLVRLFDEQESFYKIGITRYKNPKKRFTHGCVYSCDVISHKRMAAKEAWDFEKKLLNLCFKDKYIPKREMNGKTECFSSISGHIAEFFGVHNV